MLDGADTGLQCRHDAGLAVAVRRDRPLRATRLLDDRAQLLAGELLVDGVVDLAEHTARRTHLDHPGVLAQLETDRAQAVRHAVAQLGGALVRAVVHEGGQRAAVEVGVAARGAQDRSGAVDRRAVEGPLVDGVREVHPVPAQLAHTGEPGLEHVGRGSHRARHEHRVGLLQELAEVQVEDAHEVHVAVPQARHHRGDPGRRGGGRGSVSRPAG
ncbi:hypothetical protein Q6346_14830 [Isoptericola sp. b490]|nr:hypothetical protein [Isoptericola sp. b490]MDO8122583.1 hypothetical protein [Isoptericola sp. b490]